MEHSRLLKYILPEGYSVKTKMADPVETKNENKNPAVQSEVPGAQKLREDNNDVSTGRDTFHEEPVIVVTKHEATFTKGDLKLQKVTVTEDISMTFQHLFKKQTTPGKTVLQQNQSHWINPYPGPQDPIIDPSKFYRRHSNTNTNNGEDKSEEKKTTSKIPVSRFKQTVERVKAARRGSMDNKEPESQIPIRRSTIPKLSSKAPAKPVRKSIQTNLNKPITKMEFNDLISTEDEFDKLYEEAVHSPTPININVSLLNPKVDDPEKLESKFEEIIHDYVENKVQPIDVEKIRKSKLPFLKRRSQHDIDVQGSRIISARDKLRMRRNSGKSDDVIGGKAEIVMKNISFKTKSDDTNVVDKPKSGSNNNIAVDDAINANYSVKDKSKLEQPTDEYIETYEVASISNTFKAEDISFAKTEEIVNFEEVVEDNDNQNSVKPEIDNDEFTVNNTLKFYLQNNIKIYETVITKEVVYNNLKSYDQNGVKSVEEFTTVINDLKTNVQNNMQSTEKLIDTETADNETMDVVLKHDEKFDVRPERSIIIQESEQFFDDTEVTTNTTKTVDEDENSSGPNIEIVIISSKDIKEDEPAVNREIAAAEESIRVPNSVAATEENLVTVIHTATTTEKEYFKVVDSATTTEEDLVQVVDITLSENEVIKAVESTTASVEESVVKVVDGTTVMEIEPLNIVESTTTTTVESAVGFDSTIVPKVEPIQMIDTITVTKVNPVIVVEITTVPEVAPVNVVDSTNTSEKELVEVIDSTTALEVKPINAVDITTVPDVEPVNVVDSINTTTKELVEVIERPFALEVKPINAVDITTAPDIEPVNVDSINITTKELVEDVDRTTALEVKPISVVDTTTVPEVKPVTMVDTINVPKVESVIVTDTKTIPGVEIIRVVDSTAVPEIKPVKVVDTKTDIKVDPVIVVDITTVQEVEPVNVVDSTNATTRELVEVVDSTAVLDVKPVNVVDTTNTTAKELVEVVDSTTVLDVKPVNVVDTTNTTAKELVEVVDSTTVLEVKPVNVVDTTNTTAKELVEVVDSTTVLEVKPMNVVDTTNTTAKELVEVVDSTTVLEVKPMNVVDTTNTTAKELVEVVDSTTVLDVKPVNVVDTTNTTAKELAEVVDSTTVLEVKPMNVVDTTNTTAKELVEVVDSTTVLEVKPMNVVDTTNTTAKELAEVVDSTTVLEVKPMNVVDTTNTTAKELVEVVDSTTVLEVKPMNVVDTTNTTAKELVEVVDSTTVLEVKPMNVVDTTNTTAKELVEVVDSTTVLEVKPVNVVDTTNTTAKELVEVVDSTTVLEVKPMNVVDTTNTTAKELVEVVDSTTVLEVKPMNVVDTTNTTAKELVEVVDSTTVLEVKPMNVVDTTNTTAKELVEVVDSTSVLEVKPMNVVDTTNTTAKELVEVVDSTTVLEVKPVNVVDTTNTTAKEFVEVVDSTTVLDVKPVNVVDTTNTTAKELVEVVDSTTVLEVKPMNVVDTTNTTAKELVEVVDSTTVLEVKPVNVVDITTVTEVEPEKVIDTRNVSEVKPVKVVDTTTDIKIDPVVVDITIAPEVESINVVDSTTITEVETTESFDNTEHIKGSFLKEYLAKDSTKIGATEFDSYLRKQAKEKETVKTIKVQIPQNDNEEKAKVEFIENNCKPTISKEIYHTEQNIKTIYYYTRETLDSEKSVSADKKVEDTKEVINKKDNIGAFTKLRSKEDRSLSKIDSQEATEDRTMSFWNELPKKQSVLSKIALFETEKPPVKSKIPKKLTKLVVTTETPKKVHIDTPLIIDEIFKPFGANTDPTNKANSVQNGTTQIVRAERVIIESPEPVQYYTEDKFHFQITSNTSSIKESVAEEVPTPVRKEPKDVKIVNKKKTYKEMENEDAPIVTPKYIPVREVLKRYESINNRDKINKTIDIPKTKISEIIKNLKPEASPKPLDAMFTHQKTPVSLILKDLNHENKKYLSVQSINDTSDSNDEVFEEHGQKHKFQPFKSRVPYKTLKSTDENFKSLQFIKDYHESKNNIKKAKSLAELDLGDAVKGKVSKLVVRMNSMDIIEKETKEVPINLNEMPRKMSVSEKIALFERKLTPAQQTPSPCQKPSEPKPRELTPEIQARIAELTDARIKYGRMENMPRMLLANGVMMPVIAVGTALLDACLTFHIVSAAIELGYRAIDSAYIYGNEKEVGDAIRAKIADGTVKREELFVISKLWSTFHRRDLVREACEASLRTMGLEYFDLYIIHNPISFKEGSGPIPKLATVLQYSESEYLDAWFGLEELGARARALGVSNFNAAQLQRVVDKARVKPTVNQVECHPYLTQQRLDDFCSVRNVALSCYGVLGSKGTPPELKSGQPAVIDDPLVQVMASGLNVTPAQLLIRYQLECSHQVVVKASSAAHLWENLQALTFNLTTVQVDALHALNRNKRNFIFKGMGDTHKNYPFNAPF